MSEAKVCPLILTAGIGSGRGGTLTGKGANASSHANAGVNVEEATEVVLVVQAATARELQRKFGSAGETKTTATRRYCHRGYMCTVTVGEMGMLRDDDGDFGGCPGSRGGGDADIGFQFGHTASVGAGAGTLDF